MRNALAPTLWLALLAGLTFAMPLLEPLLAWIEPDRQSVLYQRESLAALLLNHSMLVVGATLVAALVGIGAGIAVTRPGGRDFLPLASRLASIGQTFPPVAVLALAVPMIGFGNGPTLLALMLYGLLPILRNTLAGLDGVAPAVKEAGTGMGLSRPALLLQVELPLSKRVILAGIRTSMTINMATAAIGSTVGTQTLGDPVIAGLVNGNTAYVLQGALLIAVLALFTDSLFEAIERRWAIA
ncbi:osmoprotectant uptake system permease [Tamilnaduibacter salinus]|uniref:Osmoprotectant uptake system permease n=1 Tax=Tamilnaduibacter salinus TaxID=1484056 RepID=A0A2A2I0Z6_9GAMM|nr:ABC transporter permease [Tamilnaduibacter salinus]PAV24944.1 osmoprotectant uptake system permease [Tamilnaduibacter salinus]